MLGIIKKKELYLIDLIFIISVKKRLRGFIPIVLDTVQTYHLNKVLASKNLLKE